MWALIGMIKKHYPEEEEDHEEQLALFSTKELAQEYERASRLSSYREYGCGRGQHGKQYRKTSLLSMYCSADIREYSEERLPVDPKLG